VSSHLSELRGRRLAQQLHGRVFASLRDVHAAAGAFGWTRAAVDDALGMLADRGELREDLHGQLVIGKIAQGR